MAAQQQNDVGHAAVDGAAPEVQDEFDRLWRSLDSANAAIHSLEMQVAKLRKAPDPVQYAPHPDYRMAEPVNVEFDEVTSLGVDGPCGCEEAVALRAEVTALENQLEDTALLRENFEKSEGELAQLRERVSRIADVGPGVVAPNVRTMLLEAARG